MKSRKAFFATVFATVAALAVAYAAYPALTADHNDAPLTKPNATVDVADIYAFRSPGDSSKLVLALTVNPLSVPAENESNIFSPYVSYNFQIDSSGDAAADHVVEFRFGQATPDRQPFRATFPDGTTIGGAATPPSMEPEPNEPIIVPGPNGIRAFAGPRDDPFFFDFVGFSRTLAGTGTFSGEDSFAGFNVSAIVVEIPLDMVVGRTDVPLQIWATTSRRRATIRRSDMGLLPVDLGSFQQMERMGNPAVNTALIPFELKDLFNIGEPVNDAADYSGAIADSLMDLGTSPENIDALARIVIPDTAKLSLADPDGYPNGRRLEDDVMDTLFDFIFNQTGLTDGVDANDKAFSDTFPYMAAPHQPR